VSTLYAVRIYNDSICHVSMSLCLCILICFRLLVLIDFANLLTRNVMRLMCGRCASWYRMS